MQTDKIHINSEGKGFEEALREAEGFAVYEGLSQKSRLRIRLLAEELMGMVEAIAGDFEAEFWVEGSKEKGCEIHLAADIDMDYQKKQDLIEVSSRKRNEAAKGFMGKIREILEDSLYSIDEAGQLEAEYGQGPASFAYMGMCDPDSVAASSAVYMWSLEKYREALAQERTDSNPEAEEAWDELEKSIVASIADDVRVSIKGSRAEITIVKKDLA